MKCFDTWFPRAGLEYYYYYDQLGSLRSDQPGDGSLRDLARFVDEVEQVRQALGLDRSNFVLLGQSWGGLLAMEYAVTHQQNLKGLVISNMMASAPAVQRHTRGMCSCRPPPRPRWPDIKRYEAEGDDQRPAL